MNEPKKRRGPRIFGILFILAIVTLIFDPFGFIATKLACAVDGGLVVNEHQLDKSQGMFEETPHVADCAICQLVTQDSYFEFAEWYVRHGSQQFPEVGYYRYWIAPSDYAACVDDKILFDRDGKVVENKCFATKKIAEPSARYGFRFSRDRKWYLASTDRIVRTLTDRRNDEVIAKFVHYGYMPILFRMTDSQSFRWQCKQEIHWLSSEKFFGAITKEDLDSLEGEAL